MKKIKFIITFIFLIGNLYSQNTLKVGDKAPKLIITDYIENIPKDKNFDNKFIVLEFWATWCAPCLGAVPHLNELQNKFKNKKNLIFLSLTYEKPEKTKRTLEKIDFKTIVVSDQTKETETNFNVEGIPHTVLIDNKGIIRWIGNPYALSDIMIEEFLKNNIITEEKIENKLVTEENESENNVDKALEFLKDKNTQYIFSLVNANENSYSMAIEALSKGKFIDMNNNIKSIISKIINKPSFQINIPDNLIKNKYNLIYKNSNKVKKDIHLEILKNSLLNSLNLIEYIEIKKVEVYILKVINTKKLNISIDQDDESHSGNNDDFFVFSNSKIEILIKDISEYLNIIIYDQTGLKNNLDFIIRKGNIKEVNNDLEEYGLILEKVTKEVEFYNYK